MALSVTDSRTSPNNARLVNGTLIYDVPSTDPRAVPALTPQYTITSVANASGGTTAYTGTFTVAAIPVGSLMDIAGFVTNVVNNGTFQVVSVTATTLTLRNALGVSEVHAATATQYFPVDSRAAGAPVDSRAAGTAAAPPQNSRAALG